MRRGDKEVGAAKAPPAGAEAPRRCEGNDEHRRDRGEHRQPYSALLGIEKVRQPSVSRPYPPERPQQKEAPEETTPSRAVRQEARHLRDGEDDHEVEEEFQRRDPLFTLSLSTVATDPGHCSLPTHVPLEQEVFIVSLLRSACRTWVAFSAGPSA